jgi:flagellar hook protein FlgE
MGVYGALFSAVSGLKAQAQNMGIISDNISNANTVGYKASVNKFETLVTSPATPTTYTPGGVLSRPFAQVDQQGLMAASQSRTDVGISGRGFLPVTDSVSSGGALNTSVNTLFTRAGSFVVDRNGNLQNSAGFFLLGVPISQTTGQPITTNPSVQSLSLVNVGTLTGIAKGTTNLSVGANLPAQPTATSPLAMSGIVNLTTATKVTDTGPNGKGFDLYSSTGNLYHTASIQLVQTGAGASTYDVEIPNLTAITTNAPATNPAAGPFTIGQMTIAASGSTYTAGSGITFTDGSTYNPDIDATNLKSGAATALGLTAVEPHDITAVVYDSLGVAQNLTLEFSRQTQSSATAATAATTLANTWTVTIKNMTTVANGQTSVTFPTPAGGTSFPLFLDGTSALASSAVAIPAQSVLTFNTNGTLLSGPSSLPALPMADGAANFGGATTPVTLNLGTVGTPSGMTQYSSKFDVSFLNQNGLAFSFRTGVAFDQNGVVSAVFDNGTVIPLFQIPLVNFSNVDALQAETGNVFTETVQSGSAVANFAGLGGVGTVTPSALEQSTVDLSTEFANMIITQRSFSANARTITTADNELQEVVNLVR